MLSTPSNLRILFLTALAGGALSSRISYFSDGECNNFRYDVRGPNGYPDGDCTLLGTKGNFSSFQVVRLDRGCDVTLYGANTAQGICSPGGSIVADSGRCYNDSSWTYYSIDTCIQQEQEESNASSSSASSSAFIPTTSPPASSTPSPSAPTEPSSDTSSSDTNTGAIAGGVVGGVGGLALILGGAWFLLRRRKKQGGAQAMAASEVSGEPIVEMSAKEAQKPSELPESRSPRFETNADPVPQELDAAEEGGGVTAGRGRGEKPPL